MTNKNQEKEKKVTDEVMVGLVSHKLKPPTETESYDWPGGYAKRFDMIDKGGSEQAAELDKINAPDGKRVINIRAEREAAASVAIFGTSDIRHFGSGHTLKIETFQNDYISSPIKADGGYIL